MKKFLATIAVLIILPLAASASENTQKLYRWVDSDGIVHYGDRHGEGGSIVGAPLAGKVLIVDDVVTAGTAVREAQQIIAAAGAHAAGLVISLDRQEIGRDARSAVQEIEQTLGMPVISIIKLENLIDMLEESTEYADYLEPILEYRKKYGSDR